MKKVITFLYDYVFPNYYVPNALITEYFLLNYMHSQHNVVDAGQAFTSPSSSHRSVELLKSIFNRQLGRWPNSLSGSNLGSNQYYATIVQDSLHKQRALIEKYIYPITLTPHLDDFTAHNTAPRGAKLNGEYFWKFMSQQAIDDVKSGRALIFLDYGQENFIEKHTYENLHVCLQQSGLPKEQIVLGFNTFNGKEIYEKWFSPEERRLRVEDWPFVMCQSSLYYANISTTLSNVIKTKDTIRPNHFLFKVKSPREHRQALLLLLASKDVLGKGDWSYLSTQKITRATIDMLKQRYNISASDTLDNINNLIPRTLQHEPKTTEYNVSAWTDATTEPYLNSYFYICTETYTHGEHKSLTEKIFKPIGNCQPFLFLAYPGALAQLRKLGFKTFHPYIDETYDTVTDPVVRINLIANEVEKLCALTIEELHEWYWSVFDIVVHNYNHLLTLYETDQQSLDFINLLANGGTQ